MPYVTIGDITVGDKVTFNLYGTVHGMTEISGTLIGLLTADGVPTSSSAPTDHVNLYPSLPSDVQATITDSWRAYNYLSIKTASETLQIGIPWIVSGSLFRDDIGQAIITLTQFRDADISALRTLLTSNGYTVDSIKINN